MLAGRCDEDLGVPYQPFVEAFAVLRGQHVQPPTARSPRRRLDPAAAGAGHVVPTSPRPSSPTPRRSATASSTRWRPGWRRGRPRLRSCWSSTTSSGRPSRRSCCCVTSLRPPTPIPALVVATYRDTEVGARDPLSELLADFPPERGDRTSVPSSASTSRGGHLHGSWPPVTVWMTRPRSWPGGVGRNRGQPLLRDRGVSAPVRIGRRGATGRAAGWRPGRSRSSASPKACATWWAGACPACRRPPTGC